MNIYDQILNLCVAKDELRRNLAIPCKRNGKIMATNGHVMAMIPETLVQGEYTDVYGFPKNAENLFTSALSEASLNGHAGIFDLNELEAAISKHDKEPIYDRKPCQNPKCDKGLVECSACGNESTCDVCDGDGDMQGDNIVGYKLNNHAEIKIGEVFFSANYVHDVLGEIMRLTGSDATLLAQQPYDAIGEIKHSSYFKIGNVDFLFMPMRITNCNIEALAKGAEIHLRSLA